jgi:hypothetical protein
VVGASCGAGASCAKATLPKNTTSAIKHTFFIPMAPEIRFKGRLRAEKGCTRYRNKLCHPAQGESAPRAISRARLCLKVGD